MQGIKVIGHMGIAGFDLILSGFHGHRQKMQNQLIFSVHQIVRLECMGNKHIFRFSQKLSIEPNFANGIQSLEHQFRNIALPFLIGKAAAVKDMIAFIFLKLQNILILIYLRNDSVFLQCQCKLYRHLGYHLPLSVRRKLRNCFRNRLGIYILVGNICDFPLLAKCDFFPFIHGNITPIVKSINILTSFCAYFLWILTANLLFFTEIFYIFNKYDNILTTLPHLFRKEFRIYE